MTTEGGPVEALAIYRINLGAHMYTHVNTQTDRERERVRERERERETDRIYCKYTQQVYETKRIHTLYGSSSFARVPTPPHLGLVPHQHLHDVVVVLLRGHVQGRLEAGDTTTSHVT